MANTVTIDAVVTKVNKFIRVNEVALEFPNTAPEVRAAIGELLDGIPTLDFRGLLSGELAKAIPDDKLLLLALVSAKALADEKSQPIRKTRK